MGKDELSTFNAQRPNVNTKTNATTGEIKAVL